MGMKINFNSSAIISNNSLKLNDNKLTLSLQRLSSGYKINSAKDDAAGLAISRRMNAQIKGLNAAEQDAKDGVSVTQIADGALSEVHDILQRMNELAVKAGNGTMIDDDREFIQQEISSLAEEIDRIGQTTEYNGQKLFAGEFDLKGYTNILEIKVDSYSDSNMYGDYKFEFTGANYDEKGNVTEVNGSTEKIVEVDRPDGKKEKYRVSGDIYHLTFSGDNGDQFVLDTAQLIGDTKPLKAVKNGAGDITGYQYTAATGTVEMELSGYGAMTLQVGANENQTLEVRIEKLSLESLGFKNQDSDETKDMILKVTTEEAARDAIEKISAAITKVSAMRSKLGAYENRLEHTETNLSTNTENLTAAYSRIMDTDMTEEMTNYSNLQIISQAATSILAQANERPSQMLQLLQ
jgi:flagellin